MYVVQPPLLFLRRIHLVVYSGCPSITEATKWVIKYPELVGNLQQLISNVQKPFREKSKKKD